MDNAIPRTLLRNGEQVPQTQLRNGKGLIVLLAEPGAGKTRVMRSEADADGGILLSGSQVMHRSSLQCGATLYVDGLDEVARSGDDAIDAVLYKLAETKPSKLVLACRATQWEQRHDRTLATEFECFESPQKLHLRPLDRKEQIQLVERRYDGFELVQFFDLADRLQLTDALSNPQMLIVFADAFVMKSGSDFTRTSAYEASIAGALQEQNGVKKDKTIDYQMLHETAGSMAARMLLVGASGVNLDPVEASTDLPSVHSFDEAPDHILAVTSTKLFQPLGASDCFGFVHRTFAEYLGGQYLAKRVADSEDKLSLNRVLTWIAPEKVLRPELSGLLAWLAAHGRPEDQIAAMELNAYAVLANGDPTALRGSARRALLEALAAQAAENPYFRAEDGWRTIFADSYFDEAEAEALKSIFEDSQTPESLIDLLLDLLGDGVAATGLSPMILKMALDKDRSRYSRRKPVLTLAKLGNEDYETLVASLIEEQSDHALYLLFVAFDQRQRVDVEGDVLRDYFLQWARIIPFGVYYSEKKIGELLIFQSTY